MFKVQKTGHFTIGNGIYTQEDIYPYNKLM